MEDGEKAEERERLHEKDKERDEPERKQRGR